MVEGRSPLCRRGQNRLLVYVSLLFLERFDMKVLNWMLNLNVYLVTRICAVGRTWESLKRQHGLPTFLQIGCYKSDP